MFIFQPLAVWKLFLPSLIWPKLGNLTVKAASFSTTTATCGRDPSSAISISDSLAIAICNERIVRVVRGDQNATLNMIEKESLMIDPASATSHPFTDFKTETNEKGEIIAVSTSEMLIEVINYKSQTFLAFLDSSGKYMFTREVQDHAKEYDESQSSTVIQQSWASSPDESLYGGGQFVNGFLDYKAAPIHLVHMNLEIAVPFFVSSRGYGILWDNYGETWLNPPKLSNIINLEQPLTGEKDEDLRVASGIFTPFHSGDFWFSVDMRGELGYTNSNNLLKLSLIETPSIRKNRNIPEEEPACSIYHERNNIPKVLTCKATNLTGATSYKVVLEYTSEVMPLVFYASIDDNRFTKIETRDNDFVDYYFMVADQTKEPQGRTVFDSLIASYRELTGPAAFFAKKAYGFWQCKMFYHNQTELLDSAMKHRELSIPVDNIVQDCKYWGDLGWGPQWDKSLYPDPKGMIEKLHDDLKLNIMVTDWSKFDENTKFYKEMKEKGLLINGTNWFDPWNPAARQLYFRFMDDAIFSIGADYVWMDATEPAFDVHLNKTIYLGSGNEFRNTFSIEATKAFYEGFVASYRPEKRPLVLARAYFPGQQRHASVVWSGDTMASFEVLGQQVAMSINYQMSGDPYWTMDIGGFFRPHNQYTSKEYRMLLLRWFQFGVFVPIMRVHGFQTNTELWNYGKETQSLIVDSAIHLRYRLMPYIYSGFHRVNQFGYTMGRAMAFDFLQDRIARNISDQFMFGESFLVAPIYNLESNRTFYLPPLKAKSCHCCRGKWWDFYTGLVIEPGRYFARNVDPASMLLFVRSSIVVLAPKSQHVHDPASLASLEVRIYAGKDASFALYEDDGVDPDPSRPSTEITFKWSEKSSHLSIGKLQGREYPGMLQSREIHVVLVRHGHGVGVDEIEQPDTTVTYDGSEIVVDLSKAHEQIRATEDDKNSSELFLNLAHYTGGITKRETVS